MPTRVNISSIAETTTIQIKNGLSGRIIALFATEALISVFGALLFIDILLIDEDYPLILLLIVVTISTVFAIAAFRYLTKITEKEIIEINTEHLVIKHTSLLRSKVYTYNLNSINHFNFTGFPKYTDHPLKGESFDYLGFQTMDKQIQTVHEEGNISFEYGGRTIYFGKRLPSWEVEKINDAIISATESRLKVANLMVVDTADLEGGNE